VNWDQILHSNILNIVLAAIVLVWIFKKFQLSSLLDKRREQVIAELQDAEAKRTAALATLAELEKRTAQLAHEVESILEEAGQTAETLAKSIIEQAEADAKKLMEQAEKRIELDALTTARNLEQRLMQEALHGARQLLESTMSDKDKVRSVEDFVSALPQLAKQGEHA
jgi:F-type H+-transporting ATPase subunit b